MKRLYPFFIFLLLTQQVSAQNLRRTTSLGAQFAGSVGFLSVGIYKHNPKEKISAGLIYGFTPKNMGGPLGSLSLKLRYNPFSIRINCKLSIEPLQAGLFLVQNFGKNIDFKWGSKYPRGYYWWGSSFRQHLFFSTQVSLSMTKGCFSKASLYLEANTNDLYVYSYFSNRNTLKLYDIFFLGIGTRFYLRDKAL